MHYTQGIQFLVGSMEKVAAPALSWSTLGEGVGAVSQYKPRWGGPNGFSKHNTGIGTLFYQDMRNEVDRGRRMISRMKRDNIDPRDIEVARQWSRAGAQASADVLSQARKSGVLKNRATFDELLGLQSRVKPRPDASEFSGLPNTSSISPQDAYNKYYLD